MRKLSLVLLVLLLMAPLSLMAQDTPKAELYGGFNYVRGENSSNLGGWNAAVEGNLNNWFGLVADLGGFYKETFHEHTFLFGPQFSYRENPNVTPFFHTLFGGSAATGCGSICGITYGPRTTDTNFAMAIGGGVDFRVGEPVAIRLPQIDYLMTRIGGQTQNNLRIGIGVVFRFK